MKPSTIRNIIISIFVYVLTSQYINWYESIGIAFTFFSFIDFIENIGKKIPFLELINLYLFISCIAMPVVAYEIFDKHNELAKLWVTYMPIDSETYFSYVLPASIFFLLGTKINFFRKQIPIGEQIEITKKYIHKKSHYGIIMILIGVIATAIIPYVPSIIKTIFQYFTSLTYVGMFYTIYSPFKYKKSIVATCIGLTLAQSISTGMYGELIYASAMSILIVLGGKKVSMVSKLSIVFVGIIFVLFIQSIKAEYRKKTWGDRLERTSDPSYFGQLVWERISSPSEIFKLNRLFNITTRTNQGNIIARTLSYVPRHEPFANGETIGMAVAAAMVPRFLWPNKPITGGADLVCRFLGDCESARQGLSYNIGPIGEAYANFGVFGGIIFMFFYGVTYNYFFNKSLQISRTTPSIILWFPLIFFSFFTIENDVLSFINTFIKGIFFSWMIYKLSALILKIRI